MALYNVTITPIADSDLQNIDKYLSGFSIDIAQRHHDAIVEGITSLKTMPSRCPFVNSEFLRKKGYRWLAIRNYIVFFRVSEASKAVRIERILHSLQEFDVLL